MLERLGFSAQDRLLMINADDFGMCHSHNAAVMDLLQKGAVTSATVMMPCPWSSECAAFAQKHPEASIGVHLTLTSEWKHYKWGPLTRNGNISSLVTDEGFFPEASEPVERRAQEEQVRLELRNQIEAAIRQGIDPTHLDNHMGSVYGLKIGRDFLEIVFDLCEEYRLPFRLPRYMNFPQGTPDAIVSMARERVKSADRRGIAIIDYLLGLAFEVEEGENYTVFKGKMLHLLRQLKPGISELIIHPGLATEELKAINPHYAKRQMEYDIFLDDEVRQVIREEGIQFITWRDLREAQRNR